MNRSINMSQDQILQWEKYLGKPVEVPQGLITGNLKQAAKIPFDAMYKESSVGSFARSISVLALNPAFQGKSLQ